MVIAHAPGLWDRSDDDRVRATPAAPVWIRSIGVPARAGRSAHVGVRVRRLRDLCRHRCTCARSWLFAPVGRALDLAGLGGAEPGDPDLDAWRRSTAHRGGDRGEPERRATVADGGGAVAHAQGATHATLAVAPAGPPDR